MVVGGINSGTFEHRVKGDVAGFVENWDVINLSEVGAGRRIGRLRPFASHELDRSARAGPDTGSAVEEYSLLMKSTHEGDHSRVTERGDCVAIREGSRRHSRKLNVVSPEQFGAGGGLLPGAGVTRIRCSIDCIT